MRVSVIVPMYNVQNYIDDCLNSLSMQTMPDLDVLLVDDGCTDDTPKIAQSYVERFPNRFRMVHKKNGGLSDARNYGIPLVNADYISFLDSDDFVDPDLYGRLSEVMKDGTDVAVTDIEYYYKDSSRCFKMDGLCGWKTDTLQKQALLSPMFAWNKMYRASLFQNENYRYPTGTWYEDIPVTTMIFAKAQKIAWLHECMMHYRQRDDSIMSSTHSPRVQEIFPVLELVRKNFDDSRLSVQYHDELEYLHIEHLRLYGMFRFIRSDNSKELYDRSEEVMKQYYPNWKKNRYISNLSFKNRVFLNTYSQATAMLYDPLIKR